VTVLVAPAKLTVSLRIVGVRDDGYHLIDAEMVTLDLVDTLFVSAGDGLEIVDETNGDSTMSFDDGDDNLVRRALRLCERQAHVRVHKRIRAGAGLGGGSADAAAILRWAGFADLVAAASIGTDVAFCLTGGRGHVQGVGEIVESLPFAVRTYTLLTPPFGCSTPAVYAKWDALGGPTGANGNDLEPAALGVEPRLEVYRDALAAASGRRPRLAGSGSTWFVEGAFPGGGRVVTRAVPASRRAQTR
jgi:4-diphosphocytidyl-2-C-methyl-D-erythritol kinase